MINRKGVVPLIPIVGFILLAMLAIYLLLFLPIPKFEQIRFTINYILIVALWIIIQVLFAYGYVKVALSLKKGYLLLKKYIFNVSLKVENFIISHT